MTRKNACARFPKTTAVVFALLMLLPAFPVAAAEHTAGQIQGLVLPHVEPGDDCIPTGLSLELFRTLGAIQNRDRAYFAQDRDVPVLCIDGQPQQDYVNLINRLDAELQLFRDTLAELQRQYETRQERLVPEKPFLPPRVTLLEDEFDGNRTGGIGDWTIVNADGSAPEWQLQRKLNFSVTEGSYRFGNDEGYARGVREYLVSPEIDLRAVRGNDTLKQTLDFAKEQTKAAMRTACTGFTQNGVTPGAIPCNIVNFGLSILGDDTLISLYERQIDAAVEEVPVGQELAKLEFRYRMNFADTQDGVRVWIFTGDQAPDRIKLFDEDFGLNSTRYDCRTDRVDAPYENQTGRSGIRRTVGPTFGDSAANCMTVRENGYVVPVEGAKQTRAFSRGMINDEALTGYTADYVDVEVDLSNFVGNRIWVLFEAATAPDENQGSAYFSKGSFPQEQNRYGFELDSLSVTGDAWPRNVRLHEFTAPLFREYTDEEGHLVRARTIVPPGDENPVLHVLNGGIYRENATVTVEIYKRAPTAPTAAADFVSDHSFEIHDLKPGETRTLVVPWTGLLDDETHYELYASLDVHEFPTGFSDDDATGPNSTNVRFPNHAAASSARETNATVRSFFKRELTAINAVGNGFPIDVCESKPEPGMPCTGLFAAKKGTPRTLRVAVRNDGNAPETAIATLHVSKDGLDKTDTILDGATRDLKDLLPNEQREVTWSLGLNDPGIFSALVTFQLPDGRHVAQPVERMLFVQQTTGLVCFDDFNLNRECGPAFTSQVPVDLVGVNLTAVTVAPDGTVYAASDISDTTGALYARQADGSWKTMVDLDNETLAARFDENRPDLGFGAIRDLTFAPDGWLYMTGDNATSLRWAPNGTLEHIAKREIGAAPLKAYGGGENVTAYANQSFLLSGGSTGGVAPVVHNWVAYNWTSNQGNATNVTLSAVNQSDVIANFSHWGNFSLYLNATDATGKSAYSFLNVTVLNGTVPTPEHACGAHTVLIGDDDDNDGSSLGPAGEIRCVRGAHSADEFRFLIDVGGQQFNEDVTGNLSYIIKYEIPAARAINVTWNGFAPHARFVQPANPHITQGNNHPKVEFDGDLLVVRLTRGAGAHLATGVTVLENVNVTTRACDERVGSTCQAIVADTAPANMSGEYHFALGDTEYPEKVTGLVAERLYEGGLRFEWAPAVDNQTSAANVNYLVTRALDTTGPATVVANLTKLNYSWSDTNVTPGRVYTYRVAAQDAAGHVGPASEPIVLSGRVHEDFRAAAFYEGAVHVVSSRGQLHRFDGVEFEPVNLTVKGQRFTGELYAIAANATHAYVGGDDGTIFVHDGSAWSLTVGGDALNARGGKCTPGQQENATCLRRVRALAFHDGRVFAAGDDGLALRSTAVDAFERLSPLPLIGAQPDFQLLVETHLGTLFFVTTERNFWECTACTGASQWVDHAASVPYVRNAEGVAGPAAIRDAASTAGDTIIVGDGGLVMGFQDVSVYGNDGGWTAVANLIPTHGGAVETNPTWPDRGTWRGLPELDDTSATAQKIRVTLNHVVLSASEKRPVEVRLLAAAQPSTTQSTIQPYFHSCPAVRPAEGPDTPTSAHGEACYKTTYASSVRARFTEPTQSAGWKTDVIEFPLDSLSKIRAGQVAVDLYADETSVDLSTFWSVDDIVVELVNIDEDGVENSTLFMSYYGANAPACNANITTFCNKGSWGPTSIDPHPQRERAVYACDQNAAPACDPVPTSCPDGSPDDVGTVCAALPEEVDPAKCPPETGKLVCQPQSLPALSYGQSKWREIQVEAADVDPISAWHITRSLAERPVWALNDEVWPHAPGGSRPHLRDNWNMRLISPVIDLRNAYDPVLEFGHLYAFRTQVNEGVSVKAVDGGRVEVQYLRQGAECGAGLPSTHTCWSAFYPIEPVGGYPNATDLGYKDIPSWAGGVREVPFTPFNAGQLTIDTKANSYWGRTAAINEQGYIGDVSDTSKYQLAQFRLSAYPRLKADGSPDIVDGEQQFVNRILDEEGEPVNLSGRLVRVGFHGVTTHNSGIDPITGERVSESDSPYNHTNPKTSPENLATYGGEGWYITDIKVQGAAALGVDLVTSDLRFAVGYDVDRVGIGPGQKVPVNVTVSNRGVFDALGYTGTVEVRRVLDPVLGRTELIDTLQLAQQPVLAPGEARNHTFFWNVPSLEKGQYILRATMTPIGVDRDEDWTDNMQTIGTLATPVVARTTKEFHVDFDVTPENATSDITRYIPIYLINTGNVPLEGFTLRRIINELPFPTGSNAATNCAAWSNAQEPKPTVDCREWTTDAPVPAGTRVTLGSIDADFEPGEDLFWKAPARATYTVLVEAEAVADRLRSTADTRVSAFATFLFDDVESGVKGESLVTPAWNLTGGWAPTAPGFLSAESFAFGDVSLQRYESNADAYALTPVIDLSNARSAQLAFYHKYDFESVFDAGLVEASVDGGQTWTPLTPVKDVFNGLEKGYPQTPIVASSPLHPDGDPTKLLYGYTGSSSDLPANTDGWVLTQFDLTSYAGVTKFDVPYEQFALTQLDNAGYANKTRNGKATYLADRWEVGAVDDYRYWETQNLTEDRISNRVGPETFWWAGSASLADDGERPRHNLFLNIPVDLREIPKSSPKVVEVEWWEWLDRTNMKKYAVPPIDSTFAGPGELPEGDLRFVRGAFTWTPTAASHTWRFNVTDPQVVERDGHWYRMVATLDETYKGEYFDLSFAYATVKRPGDNLELAPRYKDDPGFAVDGFTVRAYRTVNGQPTDIVTLMDETKAWDASFVTTCADPWSAGGSTHVPCYQSSLHPTHKKRLPLPRVPVPEGSPTWTLRNESVKGLPTFWHIEEVKDEKGSKKLATGEPVKAFYSGDVTCKTYNSCSSNDSDYDRRCHHDRRVAGPITSTCIAPFSEARLVTPAIDMGIVAGENAELTFMHRFAFYNEDRMFSKRHPLGSGGVVEVQEFDPQTGEWGPWKQVFNASDVADTELELLQIKSRWGDRAPTCCFGYTGYTSNNSTAGSGGPYYLDPPFEPVYNETAKRDFMYMFTGVSGQSPSKYQHAARVLPEWERGEGWIESRFDVSDYIGKQVRFGFHYFISGYSRSTQSSSQCLVTDTVNNAYVCEGGWWLRDVAVRGDVLAGEPLQLRMRAATDGSVNEGGWLVDDIGLFGARYQNNVGVFVDQTQAPFGAIAGDTTQVPVTIRNLGSTVRRGLALEVIQLNQDASGAALEFASADAPSTMYETEGVKLFRIAGVDLGPGASQSFTIDVTAPDTFGPDARNQTVLLVLKEYNANAKQYTIIADNEVQGFLRAHVPFTLRTNGDLDVKQLTTLPADPATDEPVTLRVPLHNFGFTPVTFNVTCVAETVHLWQPTDHTREEKPTYVAGGKYPCARVLDGELVSGLTHATLAPKEKLELEFQATPTQEGFLRFRLDAVWWDGIQEFKVKPAQLSASVSVGKPAVVFAENFTDEKRLRDNWTSLQNGYRHSTDQGQRERNAMLLGISDKGGPGNSQGTYVATTPSIDLRNMSDGAYLSFWHLDKMAKGDGAHVRAQILMNEKRDSSWTPNAFQVQNDPAGNYPCLLTPIGGYEGGVQSSMQPQNPDPDSIQTDQNPAYPATRPDSKSTSPPYFFISPDGVPSSEWQLAVFNLSTATCPAGVGGKTVQVPLLGHVVRFQFAMFAGAGGSSSIENGINRGDGIGFYVDDVSVGGFRLEVKPEDGQSGLRLLDNTTKTFNVLVKNVGAITDLVGATYDAANSTAPPGSVTVQAEPVTLAPGEHAIIPVQITLPRDPTLLPTEFEVRVRATSLFDLNAGGDTTLKILFAPREWAELRVVAEAPSRAVQEGTDTFIPVVVENTGLVASVPSVLQITDRWTDSATGEARERVTRLDLPSMSSYFVDADDSRRTLEFVWRPDAGSVGDHTLTFVVDPQELGQEYTRTNNVVAFTAPVVKLLIPDLSLEHSDALVLRNALATPIVGVIDGEVVRYEVTTGELLSFQVKLRNLGAGGVTNVDVRTFIGQLSLPAKTVPFIGPGGEVTVNFNWVAQKGEYPLEVVVRSELVEVTTDNNRYPTSGVIFLTVKDYEVEVALDAPDAILEPGTEVPVPFRLTNVGNAGEEIRLGGDLPAGWSLRFPRPEMFLRAGETYEDVATLVVPDAAVAGEQFISMLAVSRENPMKMAASQTTVEVRAFHEGRVLSSVATVAPPSFVLPVRLANEGNSLQPWSVNLLLPAGWTTVDALPLNVSVPPRGETTVDVRVNVPSATPPGLREVRINATMPDGEHREGKVAVEMTERRGATLALSALVPLETRGALSYPVEIGNVGNVRQPFRIVLMDAPAGVEVSVKPDRFELAPGQKATATLRVAPNATVESGAYGVRLYALFDGVHPDSAEGRANLHDVEVTLARPDLAVVQVEQSPRADVKEGDRVTVRATIVNHGPAPATNLPVHLYADDLFVAETRIAAIQAGETIEVELNWTALAGQHTLTIVVDPYSDKLDATTDDHAAAVEANVASTGPLGQNAAGRLSGIPAPGLFGILTALAAAVALTTVGRRRIAK